MNKQTLNPSDQIRRLTQSFPSVCDAPGTTPWDALAFDHWAAQGGLSHGELCTAQFLLSVWDPHGDWTSGTFNIMAALRVWDQTHRTAFLEWATNPWWA